MAKPLKTNKGPKETKMRLNYRQLRLLQNQQDKVVPHLPLEVKNLAQ